jgi:hypothetical protein
MRLSSRVFARRWRAKPDKELSKRQTGDVLWKPSEGAGAMTRYKTGADLSRS